MIINGFGGSKDPTQRETLYSASGTASFPAVTIADGAGSGSDTAITERTRQLLNIGTPIPVAQFKSKQLLVSLIFDFNNVTGTITGNTNNSYQYKTWTFYIMFGCYYSATSTVSATWQCSDASVPASSQTYPSYSAGIYSRERYINNGTRYQATSKTYVINIKDANIVKETPPTSYTHYQDCRKLPSWKAGENMYWTRGGGVLSRSGITQDGSYAYYQGYDYLNTLSESYQYNNSYPYWLPWQSSGYVHFQMYSCFDASSYGSPTGSTSSPATSVGCIRSIMGVPYTITIYGYN